MARFSKTLFEFAALEMTIKTAKYFCFIAHDDNTILIIIWPVINSWLLM